MTSSVEGGYALTLVGTNNLGGGLVLADGSFVLHGDRYDPNPAYTPELEDVVRYAQDGAYRSVATLRGSGDSELNVSALAPDGTIAVSGRLGGDLVIPGGARLDDPGRDNVGYLARFRDNAAR